MTGPSVFGLPHLSEDAVAAFADGRLSPSATARARKHCAECAECAEAVRGQREAAMLLRTASAPSLPAGLLDRLAGLPMSAQLPPPLSGLPTTLDSNGVPVFVAYQPQPRLESDQDQDGSEPADRAAGQPAPSVATSVRCNRSTSRTSPRAWPASSRPTPVRPTPVRPIPDGPIPVRP